MPLSTWFYLSAVTCSSLLGIHWKTVAQRAGHNIFNHKCFVKRSLKFYPLAKTGSMSNDNFGLTILNLCYHEPRHWGRQP